MREIKFRNFNIKNGMSYDIQRGCGSEGCHCSDLLQDWLNVPENNVMQYTGLKDKNGKEIYEGDLLEPESSGEKPYKVSYIGTAFVPMFWDFANSEWSIQDWMDVSKCEVIGNIYENPELLEKDKE